MCAVTHPPGESHPCNRLTLSAKSGCVKDQCSGTGRANPRRGRRVRIPGRAPLGRPADLPALRQRGPLLLPEARQRRPRRTRTGSAAQRRLRKCGACRKQFSVLTGTIMHGTKIPVRTWVFVMFEMCWASCGRAAFLRLRPASAVRPIGARDRHPVRPDCSAGPRLPEPDSRRTWRSNPWCDRTGVA